MKKIKHIILVFFLLIGNLYSEENFNSQIQKIVENNYYISAYFDVLKSQNRNAVKNLGLIFNDITYEEPEGWVTRKWYEESVFSFDKIKFISNEKIYDNIFRIGSTTLTVIDFNDFNSYYIMTLQEGTVKTGRDDDYTLLNWKEIRNAESTIITYESKGKYSWPRFSNDFIFEEDGDYLNIYYDKNKKIPFAEFARMSKNTEEQFISLIYENKCDLSKVTWPRHADGTCDYEDNKKSVTASKSSSTSKTEAIIQSEVSTPATNVSVKKTMSVSENLKLRAGEATSTQVLTVMSAGTKVKILELGKEETIDGIRSNWVKVEVQSGKDKDGKIIKKGVTGWCYGGYLE